MQEKNIHSPYHIVDAGTDEPGRLRYRVTPCSDDSQSVTEHLLTWMDAVFVASSLNGRVHSIALDAILDGRAPAPVIH